LRILHISDTHLGARPRGVVEREKDIYDVFREIVDIAISNKVDLVLHAGDMFHDVELYPAPYMVAIEALSRLRDRGIQFYAVAGNHDALRPTRNSPLELLQRLGLLVLLSDSEEPGSRRAVGSSGVEVEVQGFSYKAVDRVFTASPSQRAPSILLAHIRLCDAWSQRYGRDQRLCSSKESGAPVVSKLPRGYVYYALGDLHRSWRSTYGGAPIAYPGSPEAISRDDYEEVKRVFIVDIDGRSASLREVQLKSVRPWIYVEARDYRELLQRIQELEARARGFSKPPMVVVRVRSRLGKLERERAVGVLEGLARERKILAYDGPEVDVEDQGPVGAVAQPVQAIGVGDAVERLFRDPDVRRFIMDSFIRGRAGGEAILKRLVEDQVLLQKLLEEPEVRKHLQGVVG